MCVFYICGSIFFRSFFLSPCISVRKKNQYTGFMEILYPMIISSVVVLATLIYASFLDIRDRRVPFVHWLPMLAVGSICTAVLLWQTTGNLSIITGYFALVASFLYADYLDNRGRTDSLGLVVYYRKASIFYYLSIVLVLPALSWFVFMPQTLKKMSSNRLPAGPEKGLPFWSSFAPGASPISMIFEDGFPRQTTG